MTVREQIRIKHRSMTQKKGLAAVLALFENKPKLARFAQAVSDCARQSIASSQTRRMWMVHPKGMCDKHLKKEHDDLHVLARLVVEDLSSLRGYVLLGWVETHKIEQRHTELCMELYHRELKVSCCELQVPLVFQGFVDITRSHMDLHDECHRCYSKFIMVWNEFKRPRVKYASSSRL